MCDVEICASMQMQIHKNFNLTWGWLGPNRVTVYASKVAAVAGMHPYVSQRDLVDEYSKVVCGDPSTGWLSQSDRFDTAIARLPKKARLEVDNLLLSNQGSTSASSAPIVDAAAGIRDITPDALAAIKHHLYTESGKQQESIVRRHTELSSGISICVDECQKFRSVPWTTLSNGIQVSVGGKHDGIDTTTHRIVEIKTRQRRFLGVPEYELLQLHAYMVIFGLRDAVLIESYNGETREHSVMFNGELWSRVTDSMTEFMTHLLQHCAADSAADS